MNTPFTTLAAFSLSPDAPVSQNHHTLSRIVSIFLTLLFFLLAGISMPIVAKTLLPDGHGLASTIPLTTADIGHVSEPVITTNPDTAFHPELGGTGLLSVWGKKGVRTRMAAHSGISSFRRAFPRAGVRKEPCHGTREA